MEYFVFFTRTLYRKLYWDNNLYYLTEKNQNKICTDSFMFAILDSLKSNKLMAAIKCNKL